MMLSDLVQTPGDGDDRKRALLSWADFNQLLGQDGLWTSHNLLLIANRSPVAVEDYCQTVRTVDGQKVRPVPRKVELYLNAGASLVANELQSFHVPIGEAATALSRARQVKGPPRHRATGLFRA